MNVTNVEIKLLNNDAPYGASVLVALASIEFDRELVIKGVKVIETGSGRLVIQFPQRPLKARCHCGTYVPIVLRYCGVCGAENHAEFVDRPYRDLCHPLSQRLRDQVNDAVLDAYDSAVTRALSA